MCRAGALWLGAGDRGWMHYWLARRFVAFDMHVSTAAAAAAAAAVQQHPTAG